MLMWLLKQIFRTDDLRESSGSSKYDPDEEEWRLEGYEDEDEWLDDILFEEEEEEERW